MPIITGHILVLAHFWKLLCLHISVTLPSWYIRYNKSFETTNWKNNWPLQVHVLLAVYIGICTFFVGNAVSSQYYFQNILTHISRKKYLWTHHALESISQKTIWSNFTTKMEFRLFCDHLFKRFRISPSVFNFKILFFHFRPKFWYISELNFYVNKRVKFGHVVISSDLFTFYMSRNLTVLGKQSANAGQHSQQNFYVLMSLLLEHNSRPIDKLAKHALTKGKEAVVSDGHCEQYKSNHFCLCYMLTPLPISRSARGNSAKQCSFRKNISKFYLCPNVSNRMNSSCPLFHNTFTIIKICLLIC